VESSIVQINKVGQTGAIAWRRIASRALFDGDGRWGRALGSGLSFLLKPMNALTQHE